MEKNLIKEKLQNLVKKYGWDKGVMSVGEKNLLKFGFNNNPIEFINIYNDLNIEPSKENLNWLLFRYKPKENLMIYAETGFLYINYREIWVILEKNFKIKEDEIRRIIKKWLNDTYGIVTTKVFASNKTQKNCWLKLTY